jgi:hypothetical protein
MEIVIQPLHITQEEINKADEYIARKYSKWFLQLVKRMRKQGYYFETMNVRGIYNFNYAGAVFPLSFSTQKEIAQYVKEIEY